MSPSTLLRLVCSKHSAPIAGDLALRDRRDILALHMARRQARTRHTPPAHPHAPSTTPPPPPSTRMQHVQRHPSKCRRSRTKQMHVQHLECARSACTAESARANGVACRADPRACAAQHPRPRALPLRARRLQRRSGSGSRISVDKDEEEAEDEDEDVEQEEQEEQEQEQGEGEEEEEEEGRLPG